ncbi:hypothetical protein JM93_00783 [Roseibium hamelinense]|uniref:Uncharacterized protein n=1 Tax=Roseibium hamelinense TaxID=150831 RepID=A0A562TJ12_9HYPH|nr:cell division protein ZapB [Roseibium hamelinense]MTI42307.1 hypothetical protein [Roseibium hamelinense]TWI93228.1 hypothetical protein JM93_00783 [Roseibium hamelinense]
MASDDSGSSTDNLYAKPHVYFLVPYNVDVGAEDDELGAMLRLGEYSDIEETARVDGYISEYYPNQHIQDAAAAGKTSTEIAAGEKDLAKGILLACDGRVLLKSRGKMYVETADYHQRTNGAHKVSVSQDITLASDSGVVVIQSGTDKDVTIRAGTTEDDESAATGTINEYAKTKNVNILGHDFEKKGSSNTITEGYTQAIFLGMKWAFNADLVANANFAGTFDLKVGLDVKITAAASLEFNPVKVNIRDLIVQLSGGVTKTQAAKNEITAMKNDITSLKAANTALTSENTALKAETEALKTSSRELEANQRGIQTTLGNLQADVKELIFYA